jgi:HlyD family secretion protein
MKKIIFTIIGLLLIVSCSDRNEKADAYGNFEAREILVSAETQGKLIELDIEEGDLLKKGEIAGWIDTSTFTVKRQQLIAQKQAKATKLENIESQVAVQKEKIETYKTEKQRIEKLLKQEAATDKQYDDIMGKLRIAKKQLHSVKTQKQSVYKELDVVDAQIKEINENIEKCRIENPEKGTVLEKYHEEGEFAMPGRTIYKLADLSQMDLRVYISGAQLPHTEIGQEVDVYIDKNKKENQKLEGKITWISSKAEFTPKIIQTKEERVDLVYAVKIRVKNDGRLKIGMPGEVRF